MKYLDFRTNLPKQNQKHFNTKKRLSMASNFPLNCCGLANPKIRKRRNFCQVPFLIPPTGSYATWLISPHFDIRMKK